MDKLCLSELQPVCANDFRYFAEKNVRPDLYAYYKSGATNETTLAENENAFKRFLFLPKMLRDVSKRNLKSNLLQSEIEHPFGISPTAIHKIGHPEGELATAKAAALTGTPMILSTLSSVKLEDVAVCYLKHYCGQKKPPLWYQLYVFKDYKITTDLIKRAESSGFTAIVVTVDAPVSGIRYQNLRNKLSLPPNTNYANLINYIDISNQHEGNFFETLASRFDTTLTWKSLMTYLRATTSLPIILKGILRVDDAKLAVDHGADGIVISNHGARQLDTVPSTLECLARIKPHIPKNVELYMDGGVRSGDDILKALCLGAKTVFFGRPALWSLSYGGTEGVVKLINILRKELDASLALNGLTDVNNLPQDLVVRASEYFC